MKPFSKISLIVLIAGHLLCNSCQSQNNPVLPQSTLIQTSTLVSPILTTEKYTVVPISPTTTQVVLSPTPITLAPPTLTHQPTLPAADAIDYVFELLHDNGGCRLPCWWGITPEQSDMQFVQSSWAAFRDISPDDGIVIPLEDDQYLRLVASITPNDASLATVKWMQIRITIYRKVGDSYENVPRNPLYTRPLYSSMPYLLSVYGPPNKVSVIPDTDARQYVLYLDYSQFGWIARFIMPLVTKDERWIGCPYQTIDTVLWLWSPKTPDVQKELMVLSGPGIDKTNSLTIQEFYEQFKDSLSTQCLETPTDVFIK